MSAPEPSTVNTIFVGRLKYTTLPQGLGQAFEKYGAISKARVVTGKIRGEIVSKGFGFVEFAEEKGFNAALADKDNITIDEAKVLVSPARPRVIRERDTAFIGGLTAEIGEEDLKAQFPACKDVRIRRRENEPGFAFVKFANNAELMDAVREVRNITIKGVSMKVSIARMRPNYRYNRRRRAPAPKTE